MDVTDTLAHSARSTLGYDAAVPLDLRAHRLFRVLPDDVWQAISAGIFRRVYSRGSCICRPYEPIGHVFIIESGLVTITEMDLRGNALAGLICSSGDVLCMAPALFDAAQDVTLTALIDTSLFHVDRTTFKDTYDRFPRFAQQVGFEYFSKLRRLERSLLALRLSVPARVAAFLLESAADTAGGQGLASLELQFSYEQVALLLGTTRETVNRVMSRLSRAGLIAVSGRRVHLLKPNALHELADSERADGPAVIRSLPHDTTPLPG